MCFLFCFITRSRCESNIRIYKSIDIHSLGVIIERETEKEKSEVQTERINCEIEAAVASVTATIKHKQRDCIV